MLRQVAPKTFEALSPQAIALFVKQLRERIYALRAIMEEETDAVSESRFRDTATVQAKKTEMSLRYMADFEIFKANIGQIRLIAPKELDALKAEHDALQSAMAKNLATLATAKAVAEGIIRGVAGEVEAKTRPSTYGANGRVGSPYAARPAPIAVSRSL